MSIEKIVCVLILYIIASLILGWLIHFSLAKVCQEMGIALKKGKKVRTWLYTSLLVFFVGLVIHVFSAQCACPCPRPYLQGEVGQAEIGKECCPSGACCR